MRPQVLLSGATGTMGRAVLSELVARGECGVVAFVHALGGREDRLAQELADIPAVRVVRGDLVDGPSVARAAAGCNVIVHCGGLVSPAADAQPSRTVEVNTRGMMSVVAAARLNAARVINVGSVAMYGDRPPPIHWGRVGDPLRVSQYDAYAVSKIVAEQLLIDSGVAWISLRQTGILTPNFYTLLDPIMFHAPPGEVLEWISPEASARAVAGLCSPQCPRQAWGHAYNLGGGPRWRTTNAEFIIAMFAALGVRAPHAWVRPHWFATRNFHGMWFADSAVLQDLVPFQSGNLAQAISDAAAAAPAWLRMARLCPAWLARAAVMWPLARRYPGILSWVARGDPARIAAYVGSVEEWRALPRRFLIPDAGPRLVPGRCLEHGYDESMPPDLWDARLVNRAAQFRGGVLETFLGATQRATWRCAAGHRFVLSPWAVLHAGHWCRRCVMETWRYPELAVASPFFAQVYDRAV